MGAYLELPTILPTCDRQLETWRHKQLELPVPRM
jgi:hypothetical protein